MSAEWYGINYPFRGGIQNVFSRQMGIRLIKNDILQLIYTNPGERVYRPDFGIGIMTFVHEQFDDVTMSDLRTRIQDQILIHETRVTLDLLEFQENRDEHRLEIRMEFSLIQAPDEVFEIKLNIPTFSEAA
jgi:phage baseplate assembly protein W